MSNISIKYALEAKRVFQRAVEQIHCSKLWCLGADSKYVVRLEWADVVVIDYVDPFFIVTFSPVSLENNEGKNVHSSSVADI